MTIHIDFIDDLPSRWQQVTKGHDDSVSSLDTRDTWATQGSSSQPDPNTGLINESEVSKELLPEQPPQCNSPRRRGRSGVICSILKLPAESQLFGDEEDTKNKRTVRFNMEKTQYHNRFDVFEMTQAEFLESYYSKTEIKGFYCDACDKADALMAPKKQNRRGSIAAWFTSGVTCNRDVSECIQEAYKTCERAKTEKGMACAGNLVHQEALIEIYSQHDMLGLEKFFFHAVRGQPKELCKVVLRCAKKSSKKIKIYDATMDETMKQVYQCISRPSRVLAHELAKAVAKSLS